MPDSAMVFFLTAALYSTARLMLEDESIAPRALARTAALLTFAYLAKPVAVLAVVPVIGGGVAARAERLDHARYGRRRAPSRSVADSLALRPARRVVRRMALGQRYHNVARAPRAARELHRLPRLSRRKSAHVSHALGTLPRTHSRQHGFLCDDRLACRLPWIRARSARVALGMAGGGTALRIRRRDGGARRLLHASARSRSARSFSAARPRAWRAARSTPTRRHRRAGRCSRSFRCWRSACCCKAGRPSPPTTHYNAIAYRNATYLDATLDRDALIVIGHYGPDVQYYVDRFGWEEDPALWTPFDEESAIRKGARYFISVEDNRLRRNDELCAFLQRYPVLDPNAQWIVYETDPAKELPGAEPSGAHFVPPSARARHAPSSTRTPRSAASCRALWADHVERAQARCERLSDRP